MFSKVGEPSSFPDIPDVFYYSALLFLVFLLTLFLFFFKDLEIVWLYRGISSNFFSTNLNSIHINLSLIFKSGSTNHILSKETMKLIKIYNLVLLKIVASS